MIPSFVQRHFVLTIILVVFVSRLPMLWFPLADRGEADVAVQTAVWMDGGIPYVDFAEDKTLLVHSWYRWAFDMFGVYNMHAVHLMGVLLILMTVAGVYYFARYTSGEKVARWAALIYACFQSCFSLSGFLAANTETLMNLFAVFGAYTFFTSMREDRPGMSMLAGALIGLSILADPSGAVLIPVCAVSMLWFWSEQKVHRWHRYLEELFLLLVGVLFPISLLVAYVSDAGGLDGFLRWAWHEHIASLAAGVDVGTFITRMVVQGGAFVLVTALLWVLAGWGVMGFARRHRWRVEVVFHLAWIAFTVPAVLLGGRFVAHSFLQFLPPLTILAAIGLVGRWDYTLRGLRMSARQRDLMRVGATVVLLVVPYLAFFALHIGEVRSMRAELLPVRAIAAYVKGHTKKQDRIFVWGHDAGIYFFSGRRPASRFVYCSYLTGMKNSYESKDVARRREPDFNAWVMLKQDFTRHPPAVIVDLAPTAWPGNTTPPLREQLFLANYVRERYERRGTVYGADIYFRK